MPIFGRLKDRQLIKHFSKEVMEDIIDTPVIIFIIPLLQPSVPMHQIRMLLIHRQVPMYSSLHLVVNMEEENPPF